MKKLFSSLLVALTFFGSLPITHADTSIVVEGPEVPQYTFQFQTADAEVFLPHDSAYLLEASVLNTGNVPWYTDGMNMPPLRLATVRPHDQEVSPFYSSNFPTGWVGTNRIRATHGAIVNPQEAVNFSFEVTAPSVPGKYVLSLSPVIEGVTFLEGEPLFINIIVDDNTTPTEQFLAANQKKIVINIAEQKLYQKIGGDTLASYIVSTGKSGMDTPRGVYYVDHKNDVRYSTKYNMYMDNWMGLRHERYGFLGYGIHKLPYWRLKNGGRLYEGEAHLGIRVSHGCVRLGYEESKTVYDWTAVGTRVEVI